MATAKGPVYWLNNGVEMPAFGLGVFCSEPEKTLAAVRSAIDRGEPELGLVNPKIFPVISHG